MCQSILLSEPDSNKTRLVLFSHVTDGVRDVSSNLHNVSVGQEWQRGHGREGIQ